MPDSKPVRLPLVPAPQTRNWQAVKDAKLLNGFLEQGQVDGQVRVVKRPGLVATVTTLPEAVGPTLWSYSCTYIFVPGRYMGDLPDGMFGVAVTDTLVGEYDHVYLRVVYTDQDGTALETITYNVEGYRSEGLVRAYEYGEFIYIMNIFSTLYSPDRWYLLRLNKRTKVMEEILYWSTTDSDWDYYGNLLPCIWGPDQQYLTLLGFYIFEGVDYYWEWYVDGDYLCDTWAAVTYDMATGARVDVQQVPVTGSALIRSNTTDDWWAYEASWNQLIRVTPSTTITTDGDPDGRVVAYLRLEDYFASYIPPGNVWYNAGTSIDQMVSFGGKLTIWGTYAYYDTPPIASTFYINFIAEIDEDLNTITELQEVGQLNRNGLGSYPLSASGFYIVYQDRYAYYNGRIYFPGWVYYLDPFIAETTTDDELHLYGYNLSTHTIDFDYTVPLDIQDSYQGIGTLVINEVLGVAYVNVWVALSGADEQWTTVAVPLA